jgi:hypothetical protein
MRRTPAATANATASVQPVSKPMAPKMMQDTAQRRKLIAMSLWPLRESSRFLTPVDGNIAVDFPDWRRLRSDSYVDAAVASVLPMFPGKNLNQIRNVVRRWNFWLLFVTVEKSLAAFLAGNDNAVGRPMTF